MARNRSLRYLAFATVCSVFGLTTAQAYFSYDDLFCSPDYHTSDEGWTRGGGASVGKASFQDMHITSSRSSLSTDPGVVQTFDFDFSCAGSWSWGFSNGQSTSGAGKGSCTLEMVYVGGAGTANSHWEGRIASFDCDLTDASGNSLKVKDKKPKPSRASYDLATLKGSAAPRPFVPGYEISSFFDVFAEISVDGGQTWEESSSSSNLAGTPEPASMAAMGVGIAALLRRRAKKA